MNCYMISYFSEYGPEDHGFRDIDDEKAKEFFNKFIEAREKERPRTSGTLHRLDPATPDSPARMVLVDHIGGE